MENTPLDQLRAICLAFPEATESDSLGAPSFRVCDKMFAVHSLRDNRSSVWCKAQAGVQEILVNADRRRFFVPPYVGRYGWIGVRLDGEVDWEELADLIDQSYRMTAPKRLKALLK